MPDRKTVYGWLLNFYPARFREEYQRPMERQFQDDYRDAVTRTQRFLFWSRAITDFAISAPSEMVREFRQDLKHALRVYRGRSLSAILAVLALGLAIGASTGIFSVMSALLVRSLPFARPNELIELKRSPVGAGNGRLAFTEWRQHSLYLEDAAAFSLEEANLRGGRDGLRVKLAETSANFFSLLGVSAASGRTFRADEEAPGHTGVAVISQDLWQQVYNGSPAAIGSVLHLNGIPLTVVGVAPPKFDYPEKANLWTPTVFDFETVPKRGAFLFQTIGRLKEGVSIGHAREMFEAEVRRSAPDSLRADEPNRARLVSLRDQIAGPVRQAGWVLGGMILLVLLTACANVAQLLLSRTTERKQELAIRAALGASRGRLMQQLFTEAVALTMLAAALGVIVAYYTCRIASLIAPAPLLTQEYTVLDWRVLGFSLALAFLVGIVFGVLPVSLLGRLQPSAEVMRIRSGARNLGTRRTRQFLVAFQAALALVLIASSITMGLTFLGLLHQDLGFRTSNVITINVSLLGTKHKGGTNEWRYYSDALSRLRTVPGVQAAGAVSYLPLANNVYMAGSFKLDLGQTASAIVMNATMPGYFQAIGTRFLAGHDFSYFRTKPPAPEIIVNESFASGVGLSNAILGRRIMTPWNKQPYVIVGVVRTARFGGPADPGSPEIYWPIQEEPPAALTFVAHVSGDERQALIRCRDALRGIDREVPIYDVMTLDERRETALARPKFYTAATLFLTGLAILLSAVGTFGTASYSIAQRTHEVGVRIALGATYGRVRTMLLRESLTPIACGVALGIAGAAALGQTLNHLIEITRPPELSTHIVAALVLLLIAVLSSWGASARVLSIEAASALRTD